VAAVPGIDDDTGEVIVGRRAAGHINQPQPRDGNKPGVIGRAGTPGRHP
jgi:hypothetical protein